MATNSTFGWPIITKSDSFSLTALSALQGAAFDSRMTTERNRYEGNVAGTGNLPATGTFTGQSVWVRAENKPYFWNGSAWQTVSNASAGTLFMNDITWTGSKTPLRWTAARNVTVPANKRHDDPIYVVNAFAADRVVWASLATTPTNSSTFAVRIMCVAPGPKSQLRLNWIAVNND